MDFDISQGVLNLFISKIKKITLFYTIARYLEIWVTHQNERSEKKDQRHNPFQDKKIHLFNRNY